MAVGNDLGIAVHVVSDEVAVGFGIFRGKLEVVGEEEEAVDRAFPDCEAFCTCGQLDDVAGPFVGHLAALAYLDEVGRIGAAGAVVYFHAFGIAGMIGSRPERYILSLAAKSRSYGPVAASCARICHHRRKIFRTAVGVERIVEHRAVLPVAVVNPEALQRVVNRHGNAVDGGDGFFVDVDKNPVTVGGGETFALFEVFGRGSRGRQAQIGFGPREAYAAIAVGLAFEVGNGGEGRYFWCHRCYVAGIVCDIEVSVGLYGCHKSYGALGKRMHGHGKYNGSRCACGEICNAARSYFRAVGVKPDADIVECLDALIAYGDGGAVVAAGADTCGGRDACGGVARQYAADVHVVNKVHGVVHCIGLYLDLDGLSVVVGQRYIYRNPSVIVGEVFYYQRFTDAGVFFVAKLAYKDLECVFDFGIARNRLELVGVELDGGIVGRQPDLGGGEFGVVVDVRHVHVEESVVGILRCQSVEGDVGGKNPLRRLIAAVVECVACVSSCEAFVDLLIGCAYGHKRRCHALAEAAGGLGAYYVLHEGLFARLDFLTGVFGGFDVLIDRLIVDAESEIYGHTDRVGDEIGIERIAVDIGCDGIP